MAAWYVSSGGWSAVTPRANSTAYVVGDLRRQGPGTPTLGQERVLRCTTAGTSGATEPTTSGYTGSNGTRGGTTTDGTVVWTDVTGNSTYGWSAPHATLTGALFMTMTAGDTVYVSNTHAESSSTQPKSIATIGSATAPLHIYSVNPSAAPPTALATGASVTYTGGAMTWCSTASYCDVYGVTFTAQSFEFYNTAYGRTVLNNCNLTFTGTSTTGLTLGSGNAVEPVAVELSNATIKFSAVGQKIALTNAIGGTQGVFTWRGGSVDATGTVPTTLFTGASAGGPALVTVQGVDLSASGSGKNLIDLATTGCVYRLIDCKLGASVSIVTGSAVSGQADVQVVNSDSSATNYRYYRSQAGGTEQQETTIVRSGGASDGTTTVSRKVVTTALSDDWTFGCYQSLPIELWNTTTSGTVTLTVATVTDGVTLTDNQAWLEVEYQGATTSPLGTWATTRVSDPVFGTPANVATDTTSTWTTTGLSSPVKQKLSVAITPKAVGLVRVYVCVAKPSTTVYYDPLAQVS